jgi:hypothetical protein
MTNKSEPKISTTKKWSENKRKRGQKNPKYVTSQHATDVQELEGHGDRHFQHHKPADPEIHKLKEHSNKKTEKR